MKHYNVTVNEETYQFLQWLDDVLETDTSSDDILYEIEQSHEVWYDILQQIENQS